MFKSMYIGDLQVHDNESDTDIFLQPNGLEGFDAPEYRLNVYDKSGEDGGTVSNVLFGTRLLTMPFFVKGDTATEYEANRRLLADACLPQRDEFGYPVPTRITFTTLTNEEYFCDVYFRKPQYPVRDMRHALCVVQAVVADSFFYKSAQQTFGNLTPSTSLGGYLSPYESPYLTDSQVSGLATIDYDGSIPVFPVVRIYGKLTNPYLINLTTGKFLSLSGYTLLAGDRIIIDNRQKTIKLNASASLLSYKTTSSEWLYLQPGMNSFELRTTDTSDTGYGVISYYSPVQGI